MLAGNTRVAPNDNRVNRTRDYGVSLLLPMAGLDEESGLLKPMVQKTRGLTALVVAAAALSFFAGAAATSGLLRTAVAGPTDLGWKAPKVPKAPKIDNWIPDWMVEDANKGKKDADEAYEDAVDVIEVGWEETVDLASPPPVLAADLEASSSSCTRDAYGKCVPAGCASYFDGCNTCNVGAVLGCTMMFCDTPQEPKCLEYKKD